ncbi:MAG: Gfo/Idh/MocA family oxidoreductase [Actinomycetota bacterium]|nr:Gfo/Idh/MocA family oxidoreductase [Actinomycetota bacterium]
MSKPVGIGVLGARSMVARLAVLPAIEASSKATLVAAASLSGPVPRPWAQATVADYQAVIDHPDVEAVYLPLPNNMHRAWTIAAAAAGKHVLCEKPLALSPDDARTMQAACDSSGTLLAEAWMTPFDPRWRRAMQLATDGLVGDITEINAAFTFTIGPDGTDNYRWSPDHGGGALLDVGIYCLGPAVQLWGSQPIAIEASVHLAPSGVDATTTVQLTWPGGQVARARVSFVDPQQQRLEIVGVTGRIVLDGDAHTGGLNAKVIRVESETSSEHSIEVEPGDPYLGMIDAFAAAVRGTQRWPRPVERSIDMLELLSQIRTSAP